MLRDTKIREWSVTPPEILAAMIELNNKHALDGRDPNSYTGIFWVLGRYDRAWGRSGRSSAVRYSENTTRKMRVRDYMRRYAG